MSEPRDRWQLSVEPDPLLRGRRAHLTLRLTPDFDLDARGASAMLRCVETYRYDTTAQDIHYVRDVALVTTTDL